MSKATTRKETWTRQGDVMVHNETEEFPAVIDFSDIMEKTEIVPDDECRAPWKDCDGWEHTVTDTPDAMSREDCRSCQRCFYDERRWRMIVIDPDDAKEWFGVGSLNYPYAGASKQVRAEYHAECLARAYEQLHTWHADGWCCFGVACEMYGEDESVWGIDDEGYADQDVREEIALQMAHALEKKGFTVTNKPPPYDARKAEIAGWKHHHAHAHGFEYDRRFDAYERYREFNRQRVNMP